MVKPHWVQGILWLVPVCLSIYLWQDSRREREPVFYMEPERTQILTKETASDAPITVLRADGTEVTSDLTAARLYFWNEGKEPIRSTNVLRPILIELDDQNADIMDFRVLKVSREVTEFKVLRNTTDSPRVLMLDFAILERDDGACIQVIYEGNPDARFRVSGTIEGPSLIRTREDSEWINRILGFAVTMGFMAVMVTVGILHGVAIDWVVSKLSKRWPKVQAIYDKTTVLWVILVFVWSLVVVIYFVRLLRPPLSLRAIPHTISTTQTVGP
jgi:hypothetical protein